MFPELISTHVQQAKATEAMLNQKGCWVTVFRQSRTRPVLEVSCPPAELLNSAVRIVERNNSGSRSVWVASFNGCRIIWR
ncbi:MULTISPECIES: hypothetical protein [Enterobacteriaceae]|uniref:hypothetical protein n=1 Tax=Enterobacteriaceae TaxID=543 RepID=UPI0013D6EA17|nr:MULTISPECIES: hypothetical protein [Enterobacteriaceae]MCE9890715.1 hypothetical protein [Kluyvera intermedia]BBR57890.1 hypothetical protein WP4W18E05_12580 [Klebsiella sp. WP4-W18-ESBL-05]BBS92859.1 hypothetical protein WP7S18C02_34740 [Klebsiella sp. WP7-S18-CRE-02]BBS97888.1 hypothetical protein WP7S18C03_34810 [Klebsiella sp. WP7-S18-CRE-03]BBT02955.1 hypothetical protein WP7S18E04_35170 [Klebsiella sp. WP7-S18-ESBL-04]